MVRQAERCLALTSARIVTRDLFSHTSRNSTAKRVKLQPVSTNPERKPIKMGPTTVDAEIVGIVVVAIVGSRR